jgi:tetratricopeptide repeat protein
MKPPVAPQRLIDSQGSLSVLLREAAAEYRQNLDAHSALFRQQARSHEARPARRRVFVLGLAAAAALVFGVVYGHFRAPSPDLLAQAEPERGPSQRPELATPNPAPPASSRAKSGGDGPRASGRAAHIALPGHVLAEPALSASAAPPLLEQSAPEPPVKSTAEVAPGASAALPAEPAADCLGFARAGNAAQAEHCFEEQAAGQNLSAEVALYELGRLRRDMLGKPEAALSALDDYARRFPHGYLSGEVLFSRLELLVKLGRSADVLQASDELLASASGKERAFEIHFLRGNLYAHSLADAPSAAREYTQASAAPGRVGDDAAFLAGVSWQNAGDAERARAAFEHYVARASARHLAEARARLSALGTTAPNESP